MLRSHFYVSIINLLLGLILLCACENDINKARKLANTDDVSVDIATNVKLKYKEEGRLVVIISAPELRRYFRNENRIEFPKGFKLEFYNGGNITCTINAGFGIRDESNKQMKASKGVKVVNRAGERVETEEMVWEELKKQIRADGKVKITTPDDILYGQGLLADETFSNYTLRKITGVVSVDDNNIPSR
jgi:LPS export ABC transporter protein LptC